MTNIIRLEIPSSVPESRFVEYLIANSELYSSALNRRAKEHDVRTEVDHYRITQIQLDSYKAIISYEIDYCLTYGCQDLEHSDTHRRQIIARREDRTFTFEIDKVIESRSTSDEF